MISLETKIPSMVCAKFRILYYYVISSSNLVCCNTRVCDKMRNRDFFLPLRIENIHFACPSLFHNISENRNGLVANAKLKMQTKRKQIKTRSRPANYPEVNERDWFGRAGKENRGPKENRVPRTAGNSAPWYSLVGNLLSVSPRQGEVWVIYDQGISYNPQVWIPSEIKRFHEVGVWGQRRGDLGSVSSRSLPAELRNATAKNQLVAKVAAIFQRKGMVSSQFALNHETAKKTVNIYSHEEESYLGFQLVVHWRVRIRRMLRPSNCSL